jgi:hypothetical protein
MLDTHVCTSSAGAALEPIAGLWRLISEVFDVAPTRATLGLQEHNSSFSVNFSVCFAAGENWSLADEYTTSRYGNRVDWLAIAATGMRLNTPSEVADKIEKRERQQVAAARRAQPAPSGTNPMQEMLDSIDLSSPRISN